MLTEQDKWKELFDLSYEKVDKLLQMHFSRKKDYGRALWCILMYQMWHEMFIEKNNYKSFLVR